MLVGGPSAMFKITVKTDFYALDPPAVVFLASALS